MILIGFALLNSKMNPLILSSQYDPNKTVVTLIHRILKYAPPSSGSVP